MSAPLLHMQGIDKSFSGIKVLDDVSFELLPGEIHALMGENGAGKSTLMKILTGIYMRDHGTIRLQGEPVDMSHPLQAQQLGISMIHQELNLIPNLSIAENIYFGREAFATDYGWFKQKKLQKAARDVLNRLDLDLDPAMRVDALSVGEQQMVEIAKSLSLETRILIMDEPTTALTEKESERLFRVMRDLSRQGVGIIYISHRMEEIFNMCDRVTVMRDGKTIGTRHLKETTMDELVRMMVGRNVTERYPKQRYVQEEVLFEVKNLSRDRSYQNISFSLKKGEVLGIAGLMGAGRTELVRGIFGADKNDSGEMFLHGKPVHIRSPEDAIRHGIGFVTEDRKNQGLILTFSVKDNIALANLDKISKRGFLVQSKELQLASSMIDMLRIQVRTPRQLVKTLSGGNQQKVVLAKWLAMNPKMFILDEPTRGVDIGAKVEIYQLINKLAQQGVGIILISSELPELIGLSDRILVLREGRLVGELKQQEADQETIMMLATGGKE